MGARGGGLVASFDPDQPRDHYGRWTVYVDHAYEGESEHSIEGFRSEIPAKVNEVMGRVEGGAQYVNRANVYSEGDEEHVYHYSSRDGGEFVDQQAEDSKTAAGYDENEERDYHGRWSPGGEPGAGDERNADVTPEKLRSWNDDAIAAQATAQGVYNAERHGDGDWSFQNGGGIDIGDVQFGTASDGTALWRATNDLEQNLGYYTQAGEAIGALAESDANRGEMPEHGTPEYERIMGPKH